MTLLYIYLTIIIFIPLFSRKILATNNLLLESVFCVSCYNMGPYFTWPKMFFLATQTLCILSWFSKNICQSILSIWYRSWARIYIYILEYIYIYIQGIIQEFNFGVGVGSHVSITLWCEFCSCGVWGEGGTVSPRSKTPSLFCYISLLDRLLIWNTVFVDNSF